MIQYSYHLWWLIPLSLIAGFLLWKQRTFHLRFDQAVLAGMRNYQKSRKNVILRLLAIFLSLLFVSMALIRPQWGEKKEEIQKKGIDILFALDISKSMNALDFQKGNQRISRLDSAKFLISEFLKKHPNNRVGLVEFAGESFVSSPLTLDYTVFQNFLQNASSHDVSKGGTDLADAILTSLSRFAIGGEEERGKALFLLSDGDETVTSAIEKQAKKAKETGISIFTIGIGSKEGAPIPEGIDSFGRISYMAYKGEIVIAQLNEKTLKSVSEFSGGEYFRVEKVTDIQKTSRAIQKIPTKILTEEKTIQRTDQFPLFLSLSFFFFLLFLLLPEGKIYKNSLKYVSLLFFLFLSGCSFQNEPLFSFENQKGIFAFLEKDFSSAKNHFQSAEKILSRENILAINNRLAGEYEQKNYQKIEQELTSLLENECSIGSQIFSQHCKNIFYLAGNTFYRIGENHEEEKRKQYWNSAIAEYEKVLRMEPKNTLAKENRDFIQKKLQEQEMNQGQKNESQSGDSPEKNDDDKKSDTLKDKENKQAQNDDKNSSDSKKEKDEEKKEPNSEKKAQEKNGNKKTEDREGTKEKGTKESRLPEEMQKEIQEYQKNMEDSEGQNQKAFNRSKSQQEQNESDPFDVFQNDPFFQSFFGNPSQDNFHKNLSDPNLKDW